MPLPCVSTASVIVTVLAALRSSPKGTGHQVNRQDDAFRLRFHFALLSKTAACFATLQVGWVAELQELGADVEYLNVQAAETGEDEAARRAVEYGDDELSD